MTIGASGCCSSRFAHAVASTSPSTKRQRSAAACNAACWTPAARPWRITSLLRQHPEEYDRLANGFLIKVTDFFRDADLFNHLGEQVLPALIADARTRGNELRLWSPGCATGEEPYTLAI